MKTYKILSILTIVFLNALAINAQTFDWARITAGTFQVIPQDIDVDAERDVYSCGYFIETVDFEENNNNSTLTASGNPSAYVIKHNDTGKLIWAKAFQPSNSGGISSISFSVKVDQNNDIILVGRFAGICDFDPSSNTYNLSSNGNFDIFIVKLTANGSFIWARSIGGSGSDEAFDVDVNNENNIYVSGRFSNQVDFNPGAAINNLSANGDDVFVLKLNNTGNYLWAINFNGGGNESSQGLAITEYNDIIIGGSFNGQCDFDPSSNNFVLTPNNSDIFIVKLDSSGSFIWAKHLTGAGAGSVLGIATYKGNEIYVTGHLNGTIDFDPSNTTKNIISNGQSDIYLVKFDSLGNHVWSNGFGSNGLDQFWDIATDVNGFVYGAGYFSGTVDFDPSAAIFNLTSAGEIDPVMIKFNPNTGNPIWIKQVKGNEYDAYNSIIIADNLSIFGCGYFGDSINFDPDSSNYSKYANGYDEAFVIKFGQCDPVFRNLHISSCDSILAPKGYYIHSSGVYFDTLINSEGCDSIITVNAQIGRNYYFSEYIESCDSALVNLKFGFIKKSGVYFDSLKTSSGCDSVFQYQVSILNSTYYSTGASACNYFESPSGKYKWTETGSYYDTLIGANGCDSILNFDLAIFKSDHLDTSIISCGSFVSATGKTYTQSGFYQDSIKNHFGCDSIVSINLTIINLNTSISRQNFTLIADVGGLSYQWLDCQNNYLPISGANSQSFVVTQNGSYALELDNGTCIDTSACMDVLIVSVPAVLNNVDIQVYPNPFESYVIIENAANYRSFAVLDMLGRILKSGDLSKGKNQITMQNLPDGAYFLQLKGENGQALLKLIKVE